MPRLLPRNKQWSQVGAMVKGIPGVCLAGLVALLLFLVKPGEENGFLLWPCSFGDLILLRAGFRLHASWGVLEHSRMNETGKA